MQIQWVLPSSGSMIVEIDAAGSGMDEWMNTRWVREELALEMQNGSLTITRHGYRETSRVFLNLAHFWPFNLRMGKVSISFNFMFFFHDPRQSESIRVDPTRMVPTSFPGSLILLLPGNEVGTVRHLYLPDSEGGGEGRKGYGGLEWVTLSNVGSYLV